MPEDHEMPEMREGGDGRGSVGKGRNGLDCVGEAGLCGRGGNGGDVGMRVCVSPYKGHPALTVCLTHVKSRLSWKMLLG
jgi:hypothetical protein